MAAEPCAAWQLVRHAELELRVKAPSAVVGDDRHFAVALTDRRGRVQAISRPSLLGALARTVEGMLAVIETVPSGAIAITNDPAYGAAHVHDFTVLAPVAQHGYAAACFHTADFGGDVLGGFNPRATEIWAEAAVIPPLVIGEHGAELELARLLAFNTRLPDVFAKDVQAAVAAVATVAAASGGVLAQASSAVPRTSERMGRMLAALTPGAWTDTTVLRHCCTGAAADIAVRLEVVGDGMLIDFAGSGAAVAGFVNSAPASTAFAATLPFVDLLAPEEVNHGLLDRVAVTVPAGSVVGAPPTAASAWGPYATAGAIAASVSGLARSAGLEPGPTAHWTLPPRRRFHVEACAEPGCAFSNRRSAWPPATRTPPHY